MDPKNEQLIAYPIEFRERSAYAKPFNGTEFGVVFEDDGETGYLYATNETADKIYDALHLYNSKDPTRPSPGEKLFIVWNPILEKAGLFYHDRLQAIVDFKNQIGCCRSGFPPKFGTWCRSLHEWNDELKKGLQ